MKCFHYFKSDISTIPLPKKFTFPFYYKPHKLCEIAVNELQNYLNSQNDFTHNFGLKNNKDSEAIGKMFGVLVVQNLAGEIGYLTAFSGKFSDHSLPEHFVSPVYNMRAEGSFFLKGEKELKNINDKILEIENNANFLNELEVIKKLKNNISEDVKKEKEKLKNRKKERKKKKAYLEKETNTSTKVLKEIEQESFNDQFYLRELKEYYNNKIKKQEERITDSIHVLKTLKKERKEKSAYLQETLFKNYKFLNNKGNYKELNDIFNNPKIKPPAGSGECSAPKLLQFAFLNELTPIAMAEFWWGKSPSSEVRKHKNYYPACQGRCKPILSHMLKGLEIDENPLLINTAENQNLNIIFEDDSIIVVNKPVEFLSVPGKEISDSVYTRIKNLYPEISGPIIVHRLDMSTSGILVVAKNKDAHKHLQSQFIKRTVMKKYIALLDGLVKENKGEINLPLRVDLDDRPRQLVCYDHGKPATTKWSVIERKNNTTRIYFYPITGRTHQLRVHASHSKGLNMAIIGDDLYGKKLNRLHLHAAYIKFNHPKTNETIEFSLPADF